MTALSWPSVQADSMVTGEESPLGVRTRSWKGRFYMNEREREREREVFRVGGERERGGVSDDDDGKKFSLSFLSLLPVSLRTISFLRTCIMLEGRHVYNPGRPLIIR